MNDTRIPSLDLLRGIAAWGVAASHFFAAQYGSESAEMLSTLFVEIFFPLSGFVLAAQINFCSENKERFKTFFMRRWMRTIPPYFCGLVATALIFNELFSKDFFLYLFFFQDVVPGAVEKQFYSIAWSLAVEEYFYLIFPVLLIILRRNPVWLAIAFVVVLQTGKLVLMDQMDGIALRTNTILRLDAIALGYLAFSCYKSKVCGLLCPLALAASILMLSHITSDIYSGNQSGLTRLLFIDSSMLLGVSVLIAFARWNKHLCQNGKTQLVYEWLGKISFPVYLFHIICYYAVSSLKGLSVWWVFSIYVALLVAVTATFHIYFEQPILRQRPKY